MKVIRLEDKNNDIFNKICEWNYNWWGIKNGNSIEEVECYLEHSLCENRLPQTYVAMIDNEPVGMYQITMSGVRIDIWTHFMRGCIIDYVH